MAALVLFALKVCLIAGVLVASEREGRPNANTIVFPDEVNSQPRNEKSININGKSTSYIPIEVPDSIINRNIINAPPRDPCKPCHKRDHKDICRKIMDCKA